MSRLPDGWHLIKNENPMRRRAGFVQNDNVSVSYLVDTLLADVAAWRRENQTCTEPRWIVFFPRIQRAKEHLLAAGVAPEAFTRWDELFPDQLQNWSESIMETRLFLLVSILEKMKAPPPTGDAAKSKD